MSNLDEIQQIDEYVRSLLRNANKKYGLKIDLDKPTRGQRLEAALAMQDEGDGFYSMEIMVGRRVNSSEGLAEMFCMLRLAQALELSDPRKFYEGFSHRYKKENK